MLHIVTGCMFAGKTTELTTIYKKLKNTKVIVLDYDTETTKIPSVITHGNLSTHDGEVISCTKLTDLRSLIHFMEYTIKIDYDIFLINEAQFFEGLQEFVKCALENKKTIYVYGLDGDFKQKKFGEILDLIPSADTYTKLYAKCKCGAKASFSKRLSTFVGQYAPDDKYIPVCRVCL